MTFERCVRPTHGMSHSLPIRRASVLLTSILLSVGAATAAGQTPSATPAVPAGSTLPVAQPTSEGTNQSATPAPSKPETRLDVAFVDGKLTVDATNASLNQVLREVAQKTGMKVSGGVSDESVFGHYGPLPVAEVLASLLDGTGSNMLLVDNKTGPSELILTARRGGINPPTSNAAMARNDSQDQQEQQYVPPVRPFQPPTATGRGPVGSNPDGSPAFGPQNQNGENAPSSGDAPKTPQQIYEQLQSLGAQHPAPPEE